MTGFRVFIDVDEDFLSSLRCGYRLRLIHDLPWDSMNWCDSTLRIHCSTFNDTDRELDAARGSRDLC